MNSKTEQSARTDVVIIGGGFGWTHCRLLSGTRQARPLPSMKNRLIWGGRAATQVHDDYHFNVGIHAFYCGGCSPQHVLKELNIRYSGGSPKGNLRTKAGRGCISRQSTCLPYCKQGCWSIADKVRTHPRLHP